MSHIRQIFVNHASHYLISILLFSDERFVIILFILLIIKLFLIILQNALMLNISVSHSNLI